MLQPNPKMKVFVCTEPLDMRKDRIALIHEIEHNFKQKSKSGDLYIFRNEASNLVKCIFWHMGGYVMINKRFENKKFMFPDADEDGQMVINGKQLKFIFSGLNLEGQKVLK